MNTQPGLRHLASATTAASVLFLLAWAAVPSDPAAEAAASTPIERLQDAALPEVGEPNPAPPPPHRLRSSLSMPYFSFAQSLKPRS